MRIWTAVPMALVVLVIANVVVAVWWYRARLRLSTLAASRPRDELLVSAAAAECGRRGGILLVSAILGLLLCFALVLGTLVTVGTLPAIGPATDSQSPETAGEQLPVVVHPLLGSSGSIELAVRSIDPSSPYSGHLRVDDRIVEIEGESMNSAEESAAGIRRLFVWPAPPVTVTVRRGNRLEKVSLPGLEPK